MRNRVRELRHDLLMTQEEFAAKAGIGVTTLRGIENGRPCYASTKTKILQALDLRPSDWRNVFETPTTKDAIDNDENVFRYRLRHSLEQKVG